jgi:NRAMP (natural resistance-associated macrophage protein)-like metal ion transporter
MTKSKPSSRKKLLKDLGPGLTTGASDNDPSGIATCSQAGAQFGYGLLWTVLFMLPLMIAIQEACARIGAVKGKGIMATLKTRYNKKVLFVLTSLLIIANTINIGADIGSMAAATQLILPVKFFILASLFTILILTIQVLAPYKKCAQILKLLCLSLLAYPLTLFVIQAPWLTIIKATFTPHLEFSNDFFFLLTALFGTTISPYMFFWQSSQEVEEAHQKKLIRHDGSVRMTQTILQKIRLDNIIGMLFSQICTWSIIVIAGAVLHTNGILTINTAADAAKALEPFVHHFQNAGYLSKLIFSIGIIGLGLISIPVLAGSSAYALSELYDWRNGLNLKFKSATAFYLVIIIATLVGLSMNFIGIDPMKALIYAAVINGIVAVPLIFIIALTAMDEKIMGRFKSGLLSNIFVWITFIAMSAVATITLFSLKH